MGKQAAGQWKGEVGTSLLIGADVVQDGEVENRDGHPRDNLVDGALADEHQRAGEDALAQHLHYLPPGRDTQRIA